MKSGNEATSSTLDRIGGKIVHVIVLYAFYHLILHNKYYIFEYL
jgi:hypothetical protein